MALAPLAVRAIAGKAGGLGAGAGAGIGGAASLNFRANRNEKRTEENRLRQEWRWRRRSREALHAGSLQGERQRRDQAYIDAQEAIRRPARRGDAERDPMLGKTVALGDEVEQWDPDTKTYDVPVGEPKAPARGGKGWTLEYGKDGSDRAARSTGRSSSTGTRGYSRSRADALDKCRAERSTIRREARNRRPDRPEADFRFLQRQEVPKRRGLASRLGRDLQKLVDDEASQQGNARGAAFGRNRPLSVLDTWNGNRPITVSAGEAEDNPDRYVTQGGGAPAMQKEALIQDIRTTIGNVGDSLKAMKAGFNAPTRAMLAASLGDPNGTAAQFFQSVPRANLDETQQNYVIDIFQLRENAMAMRSLLGSGQGSDDLRRAIVQTLPGPGTPSKGYAQQQLKRLNQTVDRLERGVPNVPLAGPGPQRGSGQGGGARDLGPAPPGRKEGDTGKLQDGTSVVVTGGRLMTQ